MAIKVALAAALLAALVAFAAATTYTTTVTTVAVDEDANPFQRGCSKQVEGRQFRACQRYLSQRGSPYEFIEDVVERQRGQGGQQQGSVQECCRELREMDQQGCGCQAIRQAAKQAQQQGQQGQGQGRGQQGQQVYQRAQQLPQACNLREQQCQFPVVFV